MLDTILNPLKKVVLGTALLAAATGPAVAGGMKDIVDTAIGAGQFTTLVTAIQKAGLVETLKSEGPFTVFAPTDAAFAKVPADVMDKLLADPETLAEVLTYHVVAGKVTAADVVKLKSAKTVQGSSVMIDTSMGVKVGNATVTATDIMTSNGVIHVIDTVLIPQTVAEKLTMVSELDRMEMAWNALGHEK